MKFLLKIFILTVFISFSYKGYSQLTLDSIVVTDVIDCYGDATGTITVYLSGCDTAVTAVNYYSIDGGVIYTAVNDSSYTFIGLNSGLYEVYAKDKFNVIVSDAAFVDEPDEIIINDEDKTDVTGCFGDNDGTIAITASDGTGTLEYSIDNGANYSNNGGNFSGLSAGTYNVWVRDANLCEKAGSAITVGQPLELQITTETVIDVMGCNGADNGSIDIAVTGGTAPFVYSIDNGSTFHSNHYFSPLTPGNYPVVVVDDNGCITNGSTLTVSEPDVISIDSYSQTDVSGCYGNDNGTITITASGGTGILYYAIDGGTVFQNNGNFTDLFAGTYNVVVKDENGCTVTGSEILVDEPDQIIIDSEPDYGITTCFGDATGGITINAHGGSGLLEYSVNSGVTWQASNVFNTLTAGSYNTAVRDIADNSCIIIGESHFITQPTLLSITEVTTTNVSTCTGGNDGSIHITTNGGGTQPYQFSIDDGASYPHSFNIEDLAAGIYNIIVQDAHFCTDTFTTQVVEIGEPSPVIITSEVPTNPICFGDSTGSIDISASGGTGSLLYSPNGGLNFYSGNILSGLSAGISYTIVVEDANGCSTTGSTITLGQPDELIINSITTNPVDDCYGGSNGSIIINATGGTAPISYSIDSEITYQLSNTFNGLSESSNHVVIKDDNNCKTDGGTIVITQPEPLLISSQSYIDVEGCHGDNLGEIHVDAMGGTPHLTNGYQFSINGSPYDYNSGDYTGLAAGDYDIVVSDENNCTANVNTITISEPDELIPDTVYTNNMFTCFGDSDGLISMKTFGIGGQSPYEFSNDNGATYVTSSSFTGLTVGTYQTWVKDNFGCERIGPEVIITQPTLLEITSVVSENVNGCFGDDDGTITITANGGTPGYMYTINLGSSWYANSGAFTNLSPGDYFIKIRDANYCETTYLDINSDLDTITITEPDLLEITDLSKVDFDCFGDDTGEIHIGATGGTEPRTFFITSGTYNDSNNTGDFTNLPAEDYTVYVEDANACLTQNYPISVYEPDLLYIDYVDVFDESCPGANDGSITIYAVGGTWPYDYSADGITFQHNRTIENLAPGTYTAEITDENSCSAIASTSVTVAEASFTSVITADVTEGCSPLTVNFSRLNEGTTQSWKFGDGTFSSLPEPEHIFENLTNADVIYTVTAYSESPAPNYCEDTVEIQITVHPQAQLLFTAAPQVSYFPNATITLTNYSPGMTNYLWDFGDGNTSTDEQAGTHTYDDCGEYIISLNAENSFNCTGSYVDTILITAHQPNAFFEVDTTQHCTPFTFNFENQSTFTESFEWVLDDGTIINDDNFSNFYETPGTYNITLNAFGYCDTYDSYDTTITVFQSPIVDFDVFPDTVMLPDQPIHCVNNSSDDGELFFWEFGDGGTSTEENPMYQYTTEGSYPIQLTVVTVNKCIDSLTYLTEVIVLPEGEAIFPNAFTPNGDGENDVFKPAVYYSVESFSMKIYNRWGELVFYTEDINNGWTGYYDGKLSLQDVYVWRAEGIYINGTPFIYAGSVTLLR